jgi:4-amino-4-deoxy-L-arabinose transferase-like glycosyltransferase
MTPVAFFTSRRLPGTATYGWLLIPILLASVNALAWTAFAAMGGSATLHPDSLEAYAWGREFQLGYYKHPPLWAWIAAGWFDIFPHTNWAFFLLSEGNASLGVLGTWALLGRFTKGPARLAGTLLLLLTTFYTFNAFRFNANTMQLSVWPWTMYFFVVSIEKKTPVSGATFGLLAGLSLLSKYYTALLLCSCFFAALVHRDRRTYFRSAAPWFAILACSLVLAPHLIWVAQHHYQPFLYALGKKGHPSAKFVDTWLGFLVICALYHVLQLAVVASVKLAGRVRDDCPAVFSIKHGPAFLTVLALAPLALTLLAGAVGYRVTPHYIVPIFSLTPFLLLLLVGASATRVVRTTVWIYGSIVAACLMVAPFLPGLSARMGASFPPYQEVSHLAENEWKSTTSAPLQIVSGSWPYAQAVAFYAPGNISEFTNFNFAWAPWITEDRIRTQGLLVVCLESDDACLAKASQYRTASTRIAEADVSSSRWRPISGSALKFTIIVDPPEAK